MPKTVPTIHIRIIIINELSWGEIRRSAFSARWREVRVQGQTLTIRLKEFNILLLPDVVGEKFSLSRVLLFQFLVAGEGLHHANVSTQWHGLFYPQTLVPGHIHTHMYVLANVTKVDFRRSVSALTTLCPGKSRTWTCRGRSSQRIFLYRDLGTEAGQRKTSGKPKQKKQTSELFFFNINSIHSIFRFGMNLFADVIEDAGDVPVLQLHVHAVAKEGQAASRLQHPIGLLEEPLVIEPMGCRHGAQKVHLSGCKW